MVQVFREIENKPKSVFNTFPKGKKEEQGFLS